MSILLSRGLLLKQLLQQKSVVLIPKPLASMPWKHNWWASPFLGSGNRLLPEPAEDQNETQASVAFCPFFENEQIEKIGHNLKYDLKVLSNYNLEVKGPLYDTLIAHYLINPDRRHGMDISASNYLNYTPQSITELIGKKEKSRLHARRSPRATNRICCGRCRHHLPTQTAFRPNSQQKMENFFMRLTALGEVSTAMEQEGINLNTASKTLKENWQQTSNV